MKASILLIALLAGAPLYAQNSSPPPPPGAEAHEAHMMENLAVLLDLTAAQRPQVEAILKAEHAKMHANMEQMHAAGSTPDHTQMHAFHEQIQQETLQQLTPILSQTQLKKFQILSEMHMHAMHGHHLHPDTESPPPQG